MADTDKLTLQINKVVTSVDNDRVEYNASERGKVLEVQIVGTNHVALDLTGKTLRFVENKTGGKIVVDDQADKGNEKDGAGIFTILDAKSGRFAYQYSRYIYQASGEAWFEVYSDSDHIDTTQKFYIDIENGTLLDVQNDNYISSLQAEIASYKATNQRLNEESDAQLNALKAKIQQSENMTDKAKSDAIAAINEAKNTATTMLNNLNSQYSSYASKYEALESKINSDIKSINDRADSQINSIKADWSEQTNAINADAKTKIDAAIAAVETARDNAIKQAVSDFSNQRDSLQADYNSWKQDTVNDFNGQLAALQDRIAAETKQQSELKVAIDSARAAVDKIDDVDFTKFAHKDDVDQALKSIDFGKIGIKENYLNPSTNVATRTIFPVKQSDGNWIFDRASDDATAETAKEALEQVLQNGKTLNQLSDQFNTKADKDDVDEALKKSNNNEGKINDLRNGKLNFTQASDGYDLLNADQTKGIIEFNNAKDIKNLPPLSNKNWMYALKLIKDNWGLVIVFSQDNTIYQNVLNGWNWAGWSRVLRSDDLTNLQNQINDRATNSKVNVDAPLFRRITSSNSWQDILGVANGNQILESIRDESSFGNTIGNYSSAVAFGGGDTKGVLNVSYADHTARIIGGNSDRPQWHEDIAWKSDITNLSNQLQAQSSTINDLKNKVSNLTPFTIITQAQYDKLTEAQKQSGTYGISG